MEQKRIAIIRIKGKASLKKVVKDTFLLLRLYKKNSCVVVPNTPSYIGMITKIKDCATWGEIDELTFKLLLEKRGKLPGNKSLTNEYIQQKLKITIDQFAKEFMNFKKELKDIPGLKHFFKLTPPKHGFEVKGIKVPFSQGGVLGYRKDQINELIQRML
jgi:large subunit ribosomal protein L30